MKDYDNYIFKQNHTLSLLAAILKKEKSISIDMENFYRD
jgi:hypothetical protein